MNYVAIIGTREPTEAQKTAVIEEIEKLSKVNDAVVSGCAVGVDALALQRAFNHGCKTTGVLPWPDYNTGIQQWCNTTITIDLAPQHIREAAYNSVRTLHPAPHKLSQGAVKLHARNYGIIVNAERVIAAPGVQLGGTGQGIRIAFMLDKPVTLIKPDGTILDPVCTQCMNNAQMPGPSTGCQECIDNANAALM